MTYQIRCHSTRGYFHKLNIVLNLVRHIAVIYWKAFQKAFSFTFVSLGLSTYVSVLKSKLDVVSISQAQSITGII